MVCQRHNSVLNIQFMRDFIRLIKPTQELSAKAEQRITTPIAGLASVLPRVLQAAIRIVQIDE